MSRASEREAGEALAAFLTTTLTRLEYPEWRDEARCREVGWVFFFPDIGDNAAVRMAKETCSGCSVVQDCLRAAWTEERNQHQAYGIRGGLSARIRTKMWHLLRQQEGATLSSEDNDTTREEAS